MKNRSRYFTSFLALLLLFCSSCVKEVDQFVPFEQDHDIDLKVFANEGDTLVYEISGLAQSSFFTRDGSYFTFKPGAFEFSDGSACQCSSVEIKVLELTGKKDLVIYQSPTVYASRVLANFRTLFVSASSDGRNLHLRSEKHFSVITPSNAPDENMQLFVQDYNQKSIVWTKAEGSSVIKAGEWKAEQEFIPGYKIEVKQFGWVAISKINSEETNNKVIVQLDNGYNQNNTVIYAISPNNLSVLPFFEDASGTFKSIIPVDTDVIFLGITREGPNTYGMALEETAIQRDHSQSLSFQSKSIGEIRSILDSL